MEPPEKKHPIVRKRNLNVLEEVTNEAMGNWFNDKEHPEYGRTRPFVKEIFKIAKAEERYKNGEIGLLSFGNKIIPPIDTNHRRYHYHSYHVYKFAIWA